MTYAKVDSADSEDDHQIATKNTIIEVIVRDVKTNGIRDDSEAKNEVERPWWRRLRVAMTGGRGDGGSAMGGRNDVDHRLISVMDAFSKLWKNCDRQLSQQEIFDDTRVMCWLCICLRGKTMKTRVTIAHKPLRYSTEFDNVFKTIQILSIQ
ncbi:hypothetical protein AB6A40_007790 [Gnathostoma spinigerum]|uniref:Uncharacterized protein n=1 Tax=Gnathostoma spinigerum TaxID=75299 RepID=A0ABD6EMS8_9BILA